MRIRSLHHPRKRPPSPPFPGKLSWILVLALTLASCGENDGSIIRMTSRERAEIDTLYSRQIRVLRPVWDSICKANFDSLVVIAVDSIVLVRKEEEIRLRARMQQENEQ